MADDFGVASTVVGLLDVAVRFIQRVRKAYERQKNLTEILDKHANAIDSLNAIVRTIIDEDALQTAAVTHELGKIRAVGSKLVKCLKELDPGSRGVARRLAHELLNGTKQEETLADIMVELDRAKASLSLRLQLANVGLTRMVRDTVLVNTEIIRRFDRILAELLGEDHGLKLATLIENAKSQDEQLITLGKSEMASLDWEAVDESGLGEVTAEGAMDRSIFGNTTQELAIQLMGPIGKDLWHDARVRIENNHASGHAVQVAYPIDFDAFKHLLDHRERMAAMGTRWIE